MDHRASIRRVAVSTALIILGAATMPVPLRGALEVSAVSPDRMLESRAATLTLTGTEFQVGTQFTLMGSAAFPVGAVATEEFCAAWDLVVAGDVAYKTCLDLQVYDISDPTAPVQIGSFSPAGSYLALDGNVLTVAGGSTLRRLDVSNPSEPTLISSNVGSAFM